MTTQPPEDSLSMAEQDLMLFAAIGLPLARMIYSGEIDPETVSRDELAKALTALGHTHEDAFEIYLTQIEEENATSCSLHHTRSTQVWRCSSIHADRSRSEFFDSNFAKNSRVLSFENYRCTKGHQLRYEAGCPFTTTGGRSA